MQLKLVCARLLLCPLARDQTLVFALQKQTHCKAWGWCIAGPGYRALRRACVFGGRQPKFSLPLNGHGPGFMGFS
jgi:hypothetical protein